MGDAAGIVRDNFHIMIRDHKRYELDNDWMS